MEAELFGIRSVALALTKMLVLVAIGYFLRLRGVLNKAADQSLSALLVMVCFPALIFAKITGAFDPLAYLRWWLFPFFSFGISIVGLAVGFWIRPLRPSFASSREFMASCAFQNGAYLPMTLVAFLASGEEADRMLVYIFFFMMGFNLAFWSFVPGFFAKNLKNTFRLTSFLNPPVIAVLLSVLLVYLLGRAWLPPVLSAPLEMLGESCFPLALLVLGAFLAEHRGYRSAHWPALALCVTAKLLLIPLLVVLFLHVVPLSPDYRFILVLEAAMPAAVTLAIVGEQQGADNQFLTGMIFYSHLGSLLTIPLWFHVFERMF